MNTFDKIRNYYAQFDEWARLDTPAGILEQLQVLHIVRDYIPDHSHILDLGSGPGKNAIAFAEIGYQITLLDISPRLIDIAKQQMKERDLSDHVKGFPYRQCYGSFYASF